jgi:hypothetical protein
MSKTPWFEVDKEGLAKLLKHKGKSFLVYELLQNSWDEDVKEVSLSLLFVPGKHCVSLVVQDDAPEGFRDISHAFTLFAESFKKGDPGKRGRYNFGEKLVLACCNNASIKTTTGTIHFNADGSRSKSKIHTEKGSTFSAEVKMTKEEYKIVCEDIKKLIPPHNIKTSVTIESGTFLLKQRTPIATFEEALPTLISDEEGSLKRTIRKTKVSVYVPEENEIPSIYEMGIPIVTLDGDKFHVSVEQKVPQNMDRDNVSPTYLRQLRAFVLNNTVHLLSGEDASAQWVNEATGDEKCSDETIKKALDLRFGEKRVVFDPSDLEANKIAMSHGYTVIPGKALSKEQWQNVKKAGAVLPAGKVTPSLKAYAKDGNPVDIIPPDKYTNGMTKVVRYSEKIAMALLEKTVPVQIIRGKNVPASATYGKNCPLTFNLNQLGHKFFDNFPNNVERLDSLLIHEFGHEYSSDHLSEEYYQSLCNLGAKLKKLALVSPQKISI